MAIDGFEPAVSHTQAQKWCRPYDPKPDVPKHTLAFLSKVNATMFKVLEMFYY